MMSFVLIVREREREREKENKTLNEKERAISGKRI